MGSGDAALIALWFVVYWQLPQFSEWAAAHLPVEPGSHLDEAAKFFIYDTPKVLMLLTLVVFGMGVVRSFFSPERTRAMLAGKREGIGNVAAAGLGVFTPFCSCSAVPLFVGFVSAGVPLGVTFSFLIAAPMVNEVALGLLFALVGWKVALTYLGVRPRPRDRLGLGHRPAASRRLAGGMGAQRARRAMPNFPSNRSRVVDRIKAGIEAVRDIVGRVWMWIIVGIAAGAFIHGYVPNELLASIMGKGAWWSVPAVVLIGIPIYSNAAGIIPVVKALLGKGAALGTVLAFMMSVIALSFPEMIILRKVLTTKLIAVFVGVVRARHHRRRLSVQRAVFLNERTSHERRKSARPGLQTLRGDGTDGSRGSREARRRGQGREGYGLRGDRRIWRRLDARHRHRRQSRSRGRIAEDRRPREMAGRLTKVGCWTELGDISHCRNCKVSFGRLTAVPNAGRGAHPCGFSPRAIIR